MVRIIKNDDCRPLGIISRDLDGIFHGFGPTVEEGRSLGKLTRYYGTQLFRQPYHGLVGIYHKTGVSKLFSLGLDGGHHFWMTVADVHDRNSPGKVDVLVTLHIPDKRTLGRFNKTRLGTGYTSRYGLTASFGEALICNHCTPSFSLSKRLPLYNLSMSLELLDQLFWR